MGIADGVKAGVLDFVDSWEGGRGERAPGYIRVRALKSEAFL